MTDTTSPVYRMSAAERTAFLASRRAFVRQHRYVMTAQEMADEIGCNLYTIKNDIAALRKAELQCEATQPLHVLSPSSEAYSQRDLSAPRNYPSGPALSAIAAWTGCLGGIAGIAALVLHFV